MRKLERDVGQGSAHQRGFDSFTYAHVGTRKTESDLVARFYPANNPKQIVSRKDAAPLLNTAYYGVWSMLYPTTLAPAARTGQCTVYDAQTDSLFIAYGIDTTGNHMSDMWALDMKRLTWRNVTRRLLEPRAYASAVLYGRHMIVFGGGRENVFFGDLHAINIDTGEVTMIPNGGECPVPRTSPMLLLFDDRLFVWGGYDGSTQNGVYTIDAGGGDWRLISHSHVGLPAPAHCVHDGQCFVFGGVEGPGMAKFIPESGEFEAMPCVGTEPPTDLSRATIVPIDEFVFLVGGEASFPYMHLFALDVKRRWWFAFHVRPDNDTLSTKDGFVNKMGLFMLPRSHSASVVYSPRERAIVSVMGSRITEPPPVFRISVGEALGVIHLRSDMLEAFVATCHM